MVRILGRGGGTADAPSATTALDPDLPPAPSHQVLVPPLPPPSSYDHYQQSYQQPYVANAASFQAYPHQNPSYRAQASPPHPHPYAGNPLYAPGALDQQMGSGHVASREKGKAPLYKRIGILTIVIVLACVVVFLVTMGVNNCPGSPPPYPGAQCVFPWLGAFSFEPLKINPMLGPSSETLLRMGSLYSPYVLNLHQSWRLLTAMWLHAGIIHIVSNMLGIYFLGVPMEREFGFLKFGLLYLLSGISGAVFSSLLLMNTVSVGASGALFGLAGATLTELCINWDLYARRVSALISLVVLILINLAIGLLPYIDNFAHIGGCMAGLLLGLVLLVKPQRGYVDLRDRDNVAHAAAIAEAGGVVVSSRNSMCQNVTRIVAAVIFLVMFFAGLGAVLSGNHSSCSWCHYLSCVPTSLWDCNTSSNPNTSGGGPVCQQVQYNNGTGVLICADNSSKTFQNMTSYSDYQLRVLCSQTCQ